MRSISLKRQQHKRFNVKRPPHPTLSPKGEGLSVLLLFSFLILTSLLFLLERPARAETYDNQSVIELNQKIKSNQQKIQDIQKQTDAYRQKIAETQKRASTLKNQISILESGISATELKAERKKIEMEELGLELNLINKMIEQETNRTADVKIKMAESLNALYQNESRGYLKILIAQSSFSQIFDELHRIEILTNGLQAELTTLKHIKRSLQDNQTSLQEKKKATEEAKQQLDEITITLEEQQNLKKRLFGETKTSEAEFQKRLSQLRSEQAAIDSDIVTLEKTIRQKQQILANIPDGQGKLSWPVNPVRGITAYFHDSEYPFRYLFEHTGMDIRVAQGTPVQAPAGGYVAKIYNGGMGNSPSYVMLMHANNLTSVFMHLSSINVSPDTYITRGQIIGASGGKPGTSGAGRWTTGPHLHFETRLNGVPVDPLSYLP